MFIPSLGIVIIVKLASTQSTRRRSWAHAIREPTGFTTPSPRLVRGRLGPAFSPSLPTRSGDVASPLATNGDAASGFFAVRFFFLARGNLGVAPALAGPRGTTAARNGDRGPSTPDKRWSGNRGGGIKLARHLDLAPTFLDLRGVRDEPALAPFRARRMSHPLTRRERTTEPVPLTSCTWLWECAFRNWGTMQGPMKLEAREWDNEYHCFNVARDPDEQRNLGEQACAPLPDLARSTFHVMPNITPPGRPQTDRGKK